MAEVAEEAVRDPLFGKVDSHLRSAFSAKSQ